MNKNKIFKFSTRSAFVISIFLVVLLIFQSWDIFVKANSESEKSSEEITLTEASISSEEFDNEDDQNNYEEVPDASTNKDTKPTVDTKKNNTNNAKPQIPTVPTQENQQLGCKGTWFHIDSMDYIIFLNYSDGSNWNAYSTNSILTNTLDDRNIVSIGHNTCSGNNCNIPILPYSQIINVRPGEVGRLCINGNYYIGKVFFSKNVSEKDTYIADPNWTGKNIFTAYTCYGQCKNAACTATKERWVVSFERHKVN